MNHGAAAYTSNWSRMGHTFNNDNENIHNCGSDHETIIK
jgi:hypothetical protein